MKWRLCIPFLLFVTTWGCGPNVKLVPVSGKITMEGAPLANVKIFTQPIGKDDDSAPGSGSFAVTDAEGRFSLELQAEPRPGAIPGEHVIRIREVREQKPSNDDTASREDFRTILPESCEDGTMRFTVPPTGSDAMNFELQRRRRR